MFFMVFILMILVYILLKLVFKCEKFAKYFEFDLILGEIKASIL